VPIQTTVTTPIRRTRLVRALELREPAINIVKRFGKWERPDKNGPRLFNCNYEDFYISYRTPFNTEPPITPSMIPKAAAHRVRRPIVLPYGLEICAGIYRNNRNLWAMKLEWGQDGLTNLRQFTSGDWEDRLRHVGMSLARSA
jgi:hypothetical protein